MQLLLGQQSQRQFLAMVIVVMALLLIKSGHSSPTKELNDGNKSSVNDESTVKKALNEQNVSLPPTEMILQGQKFEKSAVASSSDVKQNSGDEQKNDVSAKKEATKKTVMINPQTATDKTSSVSQQNAAPAATSSSSSSSYLYHHDESILNSGEEVSDSLQAGFYFFVTLSMSAIAFIIFKVYRLRLSRAERKYGVQGDRSTQELTPLPIAIEDGPSDDEDQTLFDVQRQNIRIL